VQKKRLPQPALDFFTGFHSAFEKGEIVHRRLFHMRINPEETVRNYFGASGPPKQPKIYAL
jgi:hypothetical protein